MSIGLAVAAASLILGGAAIINVPIALIVAGIGCAIAAFGK